LREESKRKQRNESKISFHREMRVENERAKNKRNRETNRKKEKRKQK